MSEERGTQIKRLFFEIEELQAEYHSKHFDQKVIKKLVENKYRSTVTERTIQRDIQLLLDMGFIEKKGDNKKNPKYALSFKQLKLRQIPSKSLYAIFYFIKYLDQFQNTPLASSMGELKTKIFDNVRDADSETVKKLEERFHFTSRGMPQGLHFDSFKKILEALPATASVDGIGSGKVLLFRDKLDPSKEKQLEPHFVFISDYALKVVGRLRSNTTNQEQQETFVVIPFASMEAVSVASITWQATLLTYSDYFGDSFGTNRDPQVSRPQAITLRFTPKLASTIFDMKWHHSEKKTKLEKGDVELKMTVKVEMDLIRWVVSFGKDVSIVEGDELRSAVKNYLNEALSHYERA